MEYNTQREKLAVPEYGRVVQKIVDHALTISDRNERTRCAKTIVGVMGNMFPQQRDSQDFSHKLWDHLAIMSNFKLDIDYPVEIATQQPLHERPQPMAYPGKRIRQRHYGYMVESLLKKLEEMSPGAERDALTELVANQMKRCLFDWNKDGMDEEKVAADMARYTNGVIQLDLKQMRFTNPTTGGGSLRTGGSVASQKQKRAKRRY